MNKENKTKWTDYSEDARQQKTTLTAVLSLSEIPNSHYSRYCVSSIVLNVYTGKSSIRHV